jgi:tryptophan halogenase
MDVPQTLRQRIDQFAQTGKVFHIPEELFAENSWIQVMMGQGITPRERHPIPDLMDDSELNSLLEGIRKRVDGTLSRLPMHMDYLRCYCTMEPAEG